MMGAIIGDILGSPYEFCNKERDFEPIRNTRPESVKDVFDYRYLIQDEYVELTIRTINGEEYIAEIEKEEQEDIGQG